MALALLSLPWWELSLVKTEGTNALFLLQEIYDVTTCVLPVTADELRKRLRAQSRPASGWTRWLSTGLLALSLTLPTPLFAQRSSLTAPRVTQEIRYHMVDAGGVFLRWA